MGGASVPRPFRNLNQCSEAARLWESPAEAGPGKTTSLLLEMDGGCGAHRAGRIGDLPVRVLEVLGGILGGEQALRHLLLVALAGP